MGCINKEMEETDTTRVVLISVIGPVHISSKEWNEKKETIKQEIGDVMDSYSPQTLFLLEPLNNFDIAALEVGAEKDLLCKIEDISVYIDRDEIIEENVVSIKSGVYMLNTNILVIFYDGKCVDTYMVLCKCRKHNIPYIQVKI